MTLHLPSGVTLERDPVTKAIKHVFYDDDDPRQIVDAYLVLEELKMVIPKKLRDDYVALGISTTYVAEQVRAVQGAPGPSTIVAAPPVPVPVPAPAPLASILRAHPSAMAPQPAWKRKLRV